MTTLNFLAGSSCQVTINQASSNDVAASLPRNSATNTSLNSITPTRNTSITNTQRNNHRYHPYDRNREAVNVNRNMEIGVESRPIEISASSASTVTSTSENTIYQHSANQSETINYSAAADRPASQTVPQIFNDNVQLLMEPVSDVVSPTSPLVLGVLPGRPTGQFLSATNPEGERLLRSQDNVLHGPSNSRNTVNRPQNQLSTVVRVNGEPRQRDSERQYIAPFSCANPSQPSFQSLASRIATYTNWCYTRAAPEVLAEAGLFSLGDGDRVKCFYCNGGLQNWRRNDDPWEEHAKWYPTCEFLLQQRGPEFIHGIVSCLPHINRPVVRRMEPARRVQVAGSAFPSSTHPPSPILPNHEQSLNDAMQSEIAQTVIGLGYDFQLVREVMESNMQTNRTTFQSTTELLCAVREAESATSVDDEPEEHYASELGTPGQMTLTASVLLMPICPSNTLGNQIEEISGMSLENELEPNNNAGTSTLQTLPSQRELLEQLRDDRTCKICLTEEADTVFVPCGHICCCLACSSALQRCLMCKAKIDKNIQTRYN